MKRLLFPLLVPAALFAQSPAAFETPLSSTQLDAAAFTEWVDGATHPVDQKEGPQWVVGLPKDHLGHSGFKYGVSTNSGPRCDVRILRGNGSQTLQRVYWTNKAAARVADVPSEAQLDPKLWGWLDFAAP